MAGEFDLEDELMDVGGVWLVGGFEKMIDVGDGIGEVDHGPGVALEGEVSVGVVE